MRLIIIGSGIAGYSACRAALETSPDVEVVVVTNETGALYSPCVLPHYLSGQIPRKHVLIPMDYGKDVSRTRWIVQSTVTAIDRERKVISLDHETLAYDSLILAVGGYSVTPPIPGVDLPGVFHCKTLSDADKLIAWPAKKAVVVGAGPIGVEVATALASRGMQVSLIELKEQVFPAVLDYSPAQVVQKLLAEVGIQVMVGERVECVVGKHRVEAVLTTKGRISADLVVFAVGISPAVKIAKEAGLRIGQTGGIETDPFLKTSDPHIWACGDCVETNDALTRLAALNMLWPNAKSQGSIAGVNAAGGRKMYHGSLSCLAISVLETFVFSFGATSQSLPGCIVREKETGRGIVRYLMQNGRVAGVQIIGDDSWAGNITSTILNPDRLWRLKPDSIRKHLRFHIPYSSKLMELVGDS